MQWYHWILILMAIAGVAGMVICLVRARQRANEDTPADGAGDQREAYGLPDDIGSDLEWSGSTRTNRRGQTSSRQRYRTRRRPAATDLNMLVQLIGAGQPNPQAPAQQGLDATTANLILNAFRANQQVATPPALQPAIAPPPQPPMADRETARQLAAAQADIVRMTAQLERTRAQAEQAREAARQPRDPNPPRREPAPVVERRPANPRNNRGPVAPNPPAAPAAEDHQEGVCHDCGNPTEVNHRGGFFFRCRACNAQHRGIDPRRDPNPPAAPQPRPAAPAAPAQPVVPERARPAEVIARVVERMGLQPAQPPAAPAAPEGQLAPPA